MMNEDAMLAGLLAQAAGNGADVVTLRAIVEEASGIGARRMLAQLGLDDASAQQDLSELRQLLAAWRDAKRSAWRAAVEWAVRGMGALLLIGIAWRLGVTDLLQ